MGEEEVSIFLPTLSEKALGRDQISMSREVSLVDTCVGQALDV